MHEAFERGHIEVICGPMFSGKSTEMIRRLKRAEIAKQKVQVFKPDIDDRWDISHVCTHDQVEFRTLPALSVRSSHDILQNLSPDTQVVGIDEAQFFDPGIITVAQAIAQKGVRVIIAGLDSDFRGMPFGPMPDLLAIAEFVDKLTAVCMVCGAPATRTQRLTESDALVEVGDKGKYEARCRKHHEV